MASPVPAKSQPLHNFNLPEQLKWNTDSDHHRRRSIQSPGRRPNPMPPSPLPHSPMLDSVSETPPPRRHSPVYSLKSSPVRGESVRGDSSSSKMLLRESPIGEEFGPGRHFKPLEEEAYEKSKGTPLIEYRRNNHYSKNSSSSYHQSKHSSASYHHSKNSSDSHHHHSKNYSDSYHHLRNYSPSSDRNLRGSGSDFNHAGGAAEKNERKPRVAPEDDAAGVQKSSKKLLIKIPKNKKPEEPNQQEETHSQKNKKDETNAMEEARVKHGHRHDVDNHKEHSPCRKIKLGLTKEDPFCKNNKLEQTDQKEPFTKNKVEATLREEFLLKKNKKEEVAVRKEEFLMPIKKRKHVEAKREEDTPLKTIRQEVMKRKEESSSKKNKPDVATQKEEPFDKKNKHEMAHRKEEPFDKKNKQEVAHRKEEPFCKRNKLEEANGKEDKRKIEGNDVDAGKDVVVQEEDKIGSTNNMDDDPKIWNLRPRKPYRNSLNVGGSGFVGSSKGETSIQSPSRNLNKKSGDNDENGSGVGEKKEKVKLSINVALTKREIEEDMFAFGIKPSRRPQKRPKHIQKAIDAVSPGMWLVGINADTYKVSERSMKG